MRTKRKREGGSGELCTKFCSASHSCDHTIINHFDAFPWYLQLREAVDFKRAVYFTVCCDNF